MFIIYNIVGQEVSKIFKYILCNDINVNVINVIKLIDDLNNVNYIFKDISNFKFYYLTIVVKL